MHRAEYVVPETPEYIQPLLIGDTIPTATLRDMDGNDFDLNAAIAQQPTVLFFYRGHW